MEIAGKLWLGQLNDPIWNRSYSKDGVREKREGDGHALVEYRGAIRSVIKTTGV